MTCIDCNAPLTTRRWLCSACCPGDEARELRADELREARDSYNRHPKDGGPECWEDGFPAEAAELEELEAKATPCPTPNWTRSSDSVSN